MFTRFFGLYSRIYIYIYEGAEIKSKNRQNI